MKHVLFIDVRNSTRSQIAEAWFNHLAAGVAEARSCGTMPSDHISGRTLQVMKETGISLRAKQPVMVTQKLMNWADMVVILGTGIFPRALMPTYIWEFEDSANKSAEQIRVLRDEIRESVERLLVEIRMNEVERFQASQVFPPRFQQVWN